MFSTNVFWHISCYSLYLYVFVRCLTTLLMSQDIPRLTVGGEWWTGQDVEGVMVFSATFRHKPRNIDEKPWKNRRSWMSLSCSTFEPGTSIIKRQKLYSVIQLAGCPVGQEITQGCNHSRHNLSNLREFIRFCYETSNNKPLNSRSNTTVFIQKSSYMFRS
jgi:hypothetical protein